MEAIVVWAKFEVEGHIQQIDDRIPLPTKWLKEDDYEIYAGMADRYTIQWLDSQIDQKKVKELTYGWYSENSNRS